MGNSSKIKKVYLAILNGGTLRREVSATVIQAMHRTPGVNLIWENPDKTWANPISSNRNLIVKRFLESDCDYLLMIDDDVVPMQNPCELVYANCDIVAMPALVRSGGNILTWTAYTPHKDGVGYSAVDLDSVDDIFDILEVAIVGTGCILVKREVLENIKAPFHSEFDEDGIQTYGTDFAFCRRATKAGYKIHTAVHYRCEHFKVVGLSDTSGWDSINYYDRSNSPYNMFWGGFSISQKDWKFIKKYVNISQLMPGEDCPAKILEFGAGLSSLLMSEICEVTSYETSEEHKKLIESKITPRNNLTIKLWDGQCINNDMQCEDSIDMSLSHNAEKPFDLVLVDGPKGISDGGVGRNLAMNIASKVSNRVIVHDAGRIEEQKFQRDYLRGIFKLTSKSGDHMNRCHYWERRPKPVTVQDVINNQRNKNG